MSWAPAREDGLNPYVVTSTSWGQSYYRIEWAKTLTEAKGLHGWTRQLHTRISVRRARTEDMEETA